ncbi:MAG TPA: GTPase [Thermoanaerobaculia bacterium]|nr:GTPase [Thermoanaerobaculia bacterium]
MDLDKWHRDVEEYCSQLVALLRDGDDSLRGIGELVERKLREHRARSKVSLAFVGQYSAGKSSIISALTGRDDIAISADITTDRCTPYDWLGAGIRLVDTPGLYTEYQDHDEMTKQEIERSDLLAFCITVALFDHITLPNFHELAIECRYWPKMLIVVNKLLSEAGDPEERIENYRANLDQMLESTLLRSVPVVFVDAKLYLEGVKVNNKRLVDKSRFAELILALNKLTKDKDLLGRADTAIRFVLNGTNEAILALSGGEESDKSFLHLLNRYLELLASARKALRREFKNAANAAARVVLEEGDELIAAVNGGGQEQFAASEMRCHQRVRDRIEVIQEELQRKILGVGASLQRDVQEIQSLPLFELFVQRVKEGGGGVEKVTSRLFRTSRLANQMGVLQKVAAGLAGLLVLTSKGNAQTVTKTSQDAAAALATSSGLGSVEHVGNASGSWHTGGHEGVAMTCLDHAITNTVDHINSTFHLHLSSDAIVQASHSTSHFLQSVGPFLALGAAATSVWGMVEEKKAEEALGRVRRELHEKFAAARDQIFEKFEKQGAIFDADALMALQKEVLAKREEAEADMASGNDRVQRLRALRTRLETSLGELATMAW